MSEQTERYARAVARVAARCRPGEERFVVLCRECRAGVPFSAGLRARYSHVAECDGCLTLRPVVAWGVATSESAP